MMKLNKTEPLKLNISIAHKCAKKTAEKCRGGKGRMSRGQDIALSESIIDDNYLHSNTTSNRCVLPDGKIVVRRSDRSADLDVSHSAGAGDSCVPGLQRAASRACVWCGAPADTYCARCEVTPYCSPRCQATDWARRHRAVCHNLARHASENEVSSPAVEVSRKMTNPAPLRRPHAVAETRERPRRPDDDTATKVSDKSERFARLQNRSKPQNNNKTNNEQSSPRRQQTNRNTSQHNTLKQKAAHKDAHAGIEPKTTKIKQEPEIQKQTKVEVAVEKPPTPKTSQVNGAVRQDTPLVKAASNNETANTLIPNNYLIELLSVGDNVLLSVDTKASECKSSTGDYVCLTMHEKFEADYQMLCEDYVFDCDADGEAFKTSPGDACSYYNESDSGWYRARCLNSTTLALLDSSRVVTVKQTDKIRTLSHKYQTIPEFCCVLESKHVELGSNLKCCITSKCGDSYKVTIDDVESGANIGEGVVSRWIPTVDYVIQKPAVPAGIPEVIRPDLKNNSVVILVEVASLDRAFVRSAASSAQKEYENVLQNVLLAGRKGSPLKEPPTKGQTVIAKFSDGLHYRALCKRTNVALNKYQLEYVEFGNVEICRNLEELFPCPPHLDVNSVPTQVSMVKLCAQGGELTPPAMDFVDTLKDSVSDELLLTLPDGESSAPSGSQVTLKLLNNNDNINKKIIEMCTPEWKKFQQNGGDVVEVSPMMYEDLEYQELPSGPLTLEILDVSVLEGGVLAGCVKGDPHAHYVFNQLTDKMAEYCNSPLGKEPYLPKIEELCIAQCPPYPQWFRAVLVEQEGGAGGAKARVCYVDYGNMEVVDVSALRKMLPDFVKGVPAVAAHLEIIDFPKNPTREMLSRAAHYMKMDDEGRGVLTVTRCIKQDEGWYNIEAPQLIKAMIQ